MTQPEKHPFQRFSILLLGTQMELGGAQKVLLTQARWMHARGHRIQVAFFYDKQGLASRWQAEHDFPVLDLGAWRNGGFILANLWRLLLGALRLFKLLRRDVEVVETFTTHSNILGLPIAWAAGVPLRLASLHGILSSRGDLLSRLHGYLVNSRIVSLLICVSEKVRRYAIQREGVRPELMRVIENGIDSIGTVPIPPEDAQALRQALAIPTDARLLLVIGRLIPAKGHSTLLRALAALPPKHADVLCLIAGEGPLRSNLEKLAEELGIIQRMRFLGSRQDIPQLLALAQVYVQPSLSEGLSIAMLEAMSAGLAVVASEVGAAGTVIEQERSGLLVPADNPQALADALVRVLESAALRDRLGKAAQQRVEDRYSSDRMCRSYEDLILEQLDQDHE